jgi:hypothetical protein
MSRHARTHSLGLVVLSLGVLFVGYFHAYGGSVKKSDPRLVGSRDLNYDHKIIPGDRIGPVKMGGLVSDAVQHLGNPDSVSRSTFRGPGYASDEVYYSYKKECIRFTWMDTGLDPRIETGWRGVVVWCDKWSTPDGLRVGDPMKDVNSSVYASEYCATTNGGEMFILTKKGIWFTGRNRNSPISSFIVVPVTDNWGGSCKDE